MERLCQSVFVQPVLKTFLIKLKQIQIRITFLKIGDGGIIVVIHFLHKPLCLKALLENTFSTYLLLFVSSELLFKNIYKLAVLLYFVLHIANEDTNRLEHLITLFYVFDNNKATRRSIAPIFQIFEWRKLGRNESTTNIVASAYCSFNNQTRDIWKTNLATPTVVCIQNQNKRQIVPKCFSWL